MKLRNVKFDKNNLFFTADTHFLHNNIIKYCNRPFKDVSEMNEELIENWNSVVKEDSTIFHLGDVAFGTNRAMALFPIMEELNGIKYLVIGNHEKLALRKEYSEDWAATADVMEIFVEDEEVTYGFQHIVMCHYPMLTWNGAHRNSWQLFGHVHGLLDTPDCSKHKPSQMDVGVDSHNLYPISYEQVKERITKQILLDQ